MAKNAPGRKVRPRPCNIPGFKAYNWIVLVYIEDLEKNGLIYGDLLRFLDSLHCKCACSPVHDSDKFSPDDVWKWCESHLDPETGDLDMAYVDSAPYVGKPKKPHVHILFMMRSKKSVEDMSTLFDLIDIRPTMWDRAEDPFSMVRYFAHLDSPDKYPYNPYDIHGFGGIKLDCLVMDDSKSRMHELTGLIMDLIDEKQIRYFWQLVHYIRREYPDPEMEACVYGKHALFNSVIKSKRQIHFDAIAEKERKRKEKLREQLGNEPMIG